MLITISVDGVKNAIHAYADEVQSSKFYTLEIYKKIVSQTLKTKIVYGTRYMVDSTKPY